MSDEKHEPKKDQPVVPTPNDPVDTPPPPPPPPNPDPGPPGDGEGNGG